MQEKKKKSSNNTRIKCINSNIILKKDDIINKLKLILILKKYQIFIKKRLFMFLKNLLIFLQKQKKKPIYHKEKLIIKA